MSKLKFWCNLLKKKIFMHLLVLAIFGKYCIRHIFYLYLLWDRAHARAPLDAGK